MSNEQLKKTTVGLKSDTGKVQWSLLPYDSIDELAKVFTAGATKYAARNWENGLKYSRVFDAMMRHASRWWQGQTLNHDDFGLHELAHVMWNACVLLHYELNADKYADFDDRPVIVESEQLIKDIAGIIVAQCRPAPPGKSKAQDYAPPAQKEEGERGCGDDDARNSPAGPKMVRLVAGKLYVCHEFGRKGDPARREPVDTAVQNGLFFDQWVSFEEYCANHRHYDQLMRTINHRHLHFDPDTP